MGRWTDSDAWMEEAKAHCWRCYDDKEETLEVQAERILEQRRRGENLVAWERRKVEITVERSLACSWEK